MFGRFASQVAVLLLSLSPGAAGAAPPGVSLDQLKREILLRTGRVREFREMAQTARELGIPRIWLFGGTASTFAHHVYDDLEREALGLPDTAGRLGYGHDSIFRVGQDVDVVLDTEDEALLSEFERRMARFKHFQGERPVWEARALRIPRGDKEALLGNPDFVNQNSDSHSTGLVDLGGGDPLGIRDLRDWDNPEGAFLRDVHRRTITFHRDKKAHESTRRFKEGLNPEILGAVRFMTKMFQFRLEPAPGSEREVREVLEGFDPERDLSNPRASSWMEKNGRKLYMHAVDVEFARLGMEELGALESLGRIGGDPDEVRSLAWWLDKAPLPSWELEGRSKGPTAGDLGIEVVAHETDSYESWESILKSPDGHPNVFGSRQGKAGESAALGDGFYTAIGREGARGTGLTVRFEVDPGAVMGEDFQLPGIEVGEGSRSSRELEGETVLVLNKRALTVIPEDLRLDAVEYFSKLASGGLVFEDSDLGIRMRIRNRVGVELDGISPGDKERLVGIARRHLLEGEAWNSDFAKEWFLQPLFLEHPEFHDFLERSIGSQGEYWGIFVAEEVLAQEHLATHGKGPGLVERMIEFGDEVVRSGIAKHVLNKELWARHERGADLLERLVGSGDQGTLRDIAMYVLGQTHWVDHPRGADFVELLIESGDENTLHEIAWNVLDHVEWAASDRGLGLIERLIESGGHETLNAISWRILIQDHWAEHERGADLVERMIESRDQGVLRSIVRDVLSERRWAEHERGAELLDLLIESGDQYTLKTAVIGGILSEEHWAKHGRSADILGRLVEFGDQDTRRVIVKRVLSEEHWAKHERGPDLLARMIESGDQETHWLITLYVLKNTHWAKRERVADLVERLIRSGNQSTLDEICVKILGNEKWAKHERGTELLELLIESGGRGTLVTILRSVLSWEHWSKHERGAEFLELLIESGDQNQLDSIAFFIFRSSEALHWVENPEGARLAALLLTRVKDRKLSREIADSLLGARAWRERLRMEGLEGLFQRLVGHGGISKRDRAKLGRQAAKRKRSPSGRAINGRKNPGGAGTGGCAGLVENLL